MQNVLLSWEVNEEMCNIVSSSLEKEWEIKFYIDSTGWSSASCETIIHMINSQKDRITLIAKNYIASSAFNIFFYSKCKREVLPKCIWMTHMARIDTSMSAKKRIQTVSKFQLWLMKKETRKQIKFLKEIWVKKKECKLFMNEYDVYFSEKRLKKFLKNQNYES